MTQQNKLQDDIADIQEYLADLESDLRVAITATEKRMIEDTIDKYEGLKQMLINQQDDAL